MERGLSIAALALAVMALIMAMVTLRDSMSYTGSQPSNSLALIFQHDMAATRMVIGVLLVLAWPLVLRGAAGLLGVTFSRPNRFLTLIGIVLGCVTYALTFLPGPGLIATLLVPTLLSLVLIRALLGVSWKHAVGFWLVQGVGITLVATASIWASESLVAGVPLNPARELPPIYEIAQRPPQVIQVVWPGKRDTSFPPLVWEPTGSYWLDHRANRVHLEIQNPDRSGDWSVGLNVTLAERSLGEYHASAERPHALNFLAQPRAQHRISITPDGLQEGDAARVWCLLPLTNSL